MAPAGVLLAGALTPSAGTAQGAPAAVYHVSRRIPLGGDASWDYLAVDTAGRRLFIARADRIMAVDPATGRVLGEIPGLHRRHGVAFAYGVGHGFATRGSPNSDTVGEFALPPWTPWAGAVRHAA